MKIRLMAVLCLLIFCFSIPAGAEESVYTSVYSALDASSLEDSLPKQAKDFFGEQGISLQDEEWYKGLDKINVLEIVISFFKSGISDVIKGGTEIFALTLLSVIFSCFCEENSASGKPTMLVLSICSAAVIIKNVLLMIVAASSVIKSVSAFMLSFIPILSGISLLSASAARSLSGTALILAVAEGISALAAFAVVPLMSAYAAIGVSAGVSPLINKSAVGEGIKKIAMWVLALVFTVFLGVLALQTSVASAADTLSLKTAKFLVGSLVPVAGSALSEAVSAVAGSVMLLKSSLGIYAVLAVAVSVLPIVAELVLWRIMLGICSAAEEMLGKTNATAVIKNIDAVIALLIGLLLFVGSVFIISLAILMRAVA